MKNTLLHMHKKHILVLKEVLKKKSLPKEKRLLIESEIKRKTGEIERPRNEHENK